MNNEIISMESESEVYCSVFVDNFDDKKMIFNAINNTDKSIEDMVGNVIKVKDIYAERYEAESNDGTEMKIMITLIDINGATYATNSKGVYNSIKRAISIFGAPTWKDGIDFEVMKVKTQNGYKATVLKAV